MTTVEPFDPLAAAETDVVAIHAAALADRLGVRPARAAG
jgi:hypothetical protein